MSPKMEQKKEKKRIAILGAGPSGLFMYKRLIESKQTDLSIFIFEQKQEIGVGMPYGADGANVEHITNVSDNEIPTIVTSIQEWLPTAPKELLDRFQIYPANFNEFKVLPRLFFGAYLSSQFELLRKIAETQGISTHLHTGCKVIDLIDRPEDGEVEVKFDDETLLKFDQVIMCTGHNWPQKYEGKVPGYFDSPYPPLKLAQEFNHPVAIRGSSLTAIDAIRTLARNNGQFTKDKNGKLTYQLMPSSAAFKMVMHSRSGLLPAVRFHLADSHLKNDSLLSEAELSAHREQNNGFISLDFIFEKDFKQILATKSPGLYDKIKFMNLEEFVAEMMQLRETLDPFVLLKAEYEEAAKSIKRHESVYWKEMLAVLSFALNYPAKYFCAEDMLRLQQTLMPLISIVIAFVPQSSCEELIALHEAAVLEIVAVGDDNEIEPKKEGGIVYHYTDEDGKAQATAYPVFIDCIGQPHLSYEDFYFPSMLSKKTISPARLKFNDPIQGSAMAQNNQKVKHDTDGHYYLSVPGIAINDNYQVVDHYGAYNSRIYIMAVPYIGGFNPDYSGLDFCEQASMRIIKSMYNI